MNTQQLLNTAIQNVVSQGMCSHLGDGSPCYKADKSTKSPVGHLVGNHYSTELEFEFMETGLTDSIVNAIELEISRELTPKERQHLFYIESAHDSACSPNPKTSMEAFKMFVNSYIATNNLPHYCGQYFS